MQYLNLFSIVKNSGTKTVYEHKESGFILAIKTGCFAPGGKFNAKSTAVLFCLFGL